MTYESITELVVSAGKDPKKVRGLNAVFGYNDDGEHIIIESDTENGSIVWHVMVYQKNGWTRTNVYHKDGTVEELYSR